MRQLLIRADDLGYSYAVNLGIARAVNEGLAGSAGLMPNMPEAARGYGWVRGSGAAIGQHTNLCLGTPCADPRLIPSLLDGRGRLRSSRDYRAAWAEGRELAEYDELVIEVKAQLARFREITGEDPEYFEAHAIQSRRVFDAIHEVAAREGLKEQPFALGADGPVTCGSTACRMLCEDVRPPEDYDPLEFLRRAVGQMEDGETCVLIFHPGYLDRFVLENSSLTVNRAKEVDMLTDPATREWLEAQQDLRLITYRDM